MCFVKLHCRSASSLQRILMFMQWALNTHFFLSYFTPMVYYLTLCFGNHAFSVVYEMYTTVIQLTVFSSLIIINRTSETLHPEDQSKTRSPAYCILFFNTLIVKKPTGLFINF